LFQYRVMQDDDYNSNDLLAAFQSEPNVIPPTLQNIENFYKIFQDNVHANAKLKNLEIKQTFQSEIFDISRKLDDYQRNIENILLSFSADLEKQWRSRLDAYINTIKAFKPTTALSLLEALSKSLGEGSKKPTNEFLSLIEFQKGICLGFLDNKENICKAFIAAFKLNPANTIFKERAALSYYKIDETDKSLALAEELLVTDEFNATAWAIKLLNSSIAEFSPLLQRAPAIVKKDIAFQVLLFNNFARKKQTDFIKLLYSNGLVSKSAEYTTIPVTVDTYSQHVFWLNTTINEYYSNFYLNFFEVDDTDHALIYRLNDLIKRFFEAVGGTEVDKGNEELYFIYAYTNFMLTKDGKYALEMNDRFPNLQNRDYLNLTLTANALQLSGYDEQAIKILEDHPSENMEALMLLAHCYIRNKDIPKYIETIKRVLSATKTVTDSLLHSYLNTIIQLRAFGKLADFSDSEFINGKSFESTNGKLLIETVVQLLIHGHSAESVTTLKSLVAAFDDPKILGLIAITFHFVSENELAVETFRKFLDKEIPSRDLLYYIYSLYHTKKDSTELLELLKKWRLNADFHPEFLKSELQIRSELLEWEECAQICKYYLENYRDDESILVNYAIALFHLNTEESNKVLAELVPQLRDFPYKSQLHVTSVSTILIRRKYFDAGLELLYRYAQLKENKKLRKDYFTACVECSQGDKGTGLLMELEEVSVGSFIKYKLNDKIFFIELTAENIQEEFYKNFLGARKGGAIVAKRPLTQVEDTIFIERVMNKYLSLHDEIMEVVSTDPYSGIPLTSITFNGNDAESVSETLKSLFGAQGTATKVNTDEQLRKYYAGELSLSEIVISLFNNDYLGGYFHLVAQQKGITTIPLIFLKTIVTEETEYVIDTSSLAILYQLATQQQVNYSQKFVISRYIVDNIKRQLEALGFEAKSEMSLSITTERVTPYIKPETYNESNKAYLTGLLTWIEENCFIEISDRVPDFTRNMEIKGGEKPFIDYTLNTLLLVEDHFNRVLITDDTNYVKTGLLPLHRYASSEFFVKKQLGEDAPALNEFIKNKYLGFSINGRQLNEEYNKKILSQSNSYATCLQNLNLLRNPNSAIPAVKHVKELALNQIISTKQQKQDITTVFVELLRGVDPGIRNHIEALVKFDCMLLGHKRDLIIESLMAAYDILDMSSNGF